ncbi:hypothetical protein QQ045_004784 [Rhodiola kirilowii]
MMQALCWNARGACNKGTMDYFRSILSTNRISLCGSLEPKAGPEKIANFCSNMGFPHFLHGNPINQKIWILWNANISVTHVDTGDQYITVKVEVGSGGLSYWHTFVYASINQTERRTLWESLITASVSYTGPWIVSGDFTMPFPLGEKRKGECVRRNTGAMFGVTIGQPGTKFG